MADSIDQKFGRTQSSCTVFGADFGRGVDVRLAYSILTGPKEGLEQVLHEGTSCHQRMIP